MLEKLNLQDCANEDLVMEFINRAGSKLADSILVRFSTNEMTERLKRQAKKGFKGWNTPQCENNNLIKRLKKNLEKGDYLDVMNLAAMLHARESLFIEKHLPNNSDQ